MDNDGVINVGIGFVTGRKSFRKVLKTYAYRWRQTSAAIKNTAKLHLFVAYDLDYNNTQIEDYLNIRPEILEITDSVFFIGQSMIHNEINMLAEQKVVSKDEAALVFDKGYAGHRNAILYYAIKKGIDYLLFLDDDEYPLAVTQTRGMTAWSGQDIFSTHLKHLKKADITNGLHCGYISPIPHMEFNSVLGEADFRLFIEAISNDIVEWDKLKHLMENGGVTYADPQIFDNSVAQEVAEINGAKFISGSNLGINLMDAKAIKPFFNPPKARGEDTFLSTCLSEHKILRVPCYTFHDGFAIYGDLLDGVLPLELKHISANNEKIISRFYRACIGWIRYKPLYMYITRPENYGAEMEIIRKKLIHTTPKLCRYFEDQRFQKILPEFEKYCRQAEAHHRLFMENQRIWESVRDYGRQNAF